MKIGPRFKKSALFLLAVAGLLAVAACSGSDPTSTPRPAPTPTATAAPAATAPVAAPVSGSGIIGGDPEFDASAMVWQGYWLSRDHFGPLVMGSGMGIPFQPPMEAMGLAMSMVAQNPSDPIPVPQNMMPLQAVYASGDSTLLNDPTQFSPMDLEGMRLDPETFDQTVRVRGQAETMLKLTQWAHVFSSPSFGAPDGDFGSLQRFIGMMVAMGSQMQGQYAMQNLLNIEDGLYRDSDGALDYPANWVMLQSLSDVSNITGPDGGRYTNAEVHPMFEGAAGQLFQALQDRQPESAREAAAAVRALAYRMWTAEDAAGAQAAADKMKEIADSSLVSLDSSNSIENAAAIGGLVAAGSALADPQYRDAADALYQKLAADFDAEHGVFNSISVYNVDDVAWIIGGLNFMSQRGNQTSRGPANDMLLAFYESTISLAGMQLSAPPGKNGVMAGEFELGLPSVLYYHPADTPAPGMNRKLPGPAEEITWDGAAWQVTSDRVVTAGSMHLANELNWLGPHLSSVPFPPIGN